MTHEESAFIRAVCQNPEDDGVRLIYADWLDEHDQPARAEFIRVQCELARVPTYRHSTGVDCLDTSRAAGLRRRERELWEAARDWLLALLWEHVPAGTILVGSWNTVGDPCYPWNPWSERGTILASAWNTVGDPDCGHSRMIWTFRRGFVEHVTCTAADWLVHGPAVVACQPVREVAVSDKRPRMTTGQVIFYPWMDGIVPEGPERIPDCLWRFMGYNGQNRLMLRTYHTEADALEALSQACLSYARSRERNHAPPRALPTP